MLIFFVYLSALRALQAEPCCTMPVLFYDLQAGRITSACLVYSWWHSHIFQWWMNYPKLVAGHWHRWVLTINFVGRKSIICATSSLGFLLVQIQGFPRFDHFFLDPPILYTTYLIIFVSICYHPTSLGSPLKTSTSMAASCGHPCFDGRW